MCSSFLMSVSPHPTDDSPEVAVTLDTLSHDGYCVLPGVIPRDEVAAVKTSIERSVSKHSSLPPPNGVITGLLRRNQSIVPYLTNSRIMAIIARLFGEHPRVSMLTALVNGPGIERGPVHADWPYNQNARAHIQSPFPDVLMNMVTMWMLTDYTIENGGTHVIPGSHKRGYAPKHGGEHDPMANYDGEVQLQGKAGDVGLFDARTWHASAVNTTKEPRVGVLVRYCPWWLNLQILRPGTRERDLIVEATNGPDAQVEPIPLSIYKTLPDDVKPLLNHMVDESC